MTLFHPLHNYQGQRSNLQEAIPSAVLIGYDQPQLKLVRAFMDSFKMNNNQGQMSKRWGNG